MTGMAALASLFDYPDGAYADRARECTAALDHPDLRGFLDEISRMPLALVQERYIETFDLNPAATLEIGWHIYGEQYERGELLVMLRRRLREAGIPERTELPDHVLHVLPLLRAMDPAERRAFTDRYLAPALEKIAAAIQPENPYSRLVRATREITAAAHAAMVPSEACND